MFDIGGGELILILLAILVLFGPKKIPELAQMLGKGMAQFRKAQANLQSQLNEIKTDINSPVEMVKESVQEIAEVPAAGKRDYPKTELSEIKSEHQGKNLNPRKMILPIRKVNPMISKLIFI